MQKKMKLEPIKLKTVRPFVFNNIDLANSNLGKRDSKQFKKEVVLYYFIRSSAI